MKRRLVIDYWWKGPNGEKPPYCAPYGLDAEAMRRATAMLQEGYTSGELCCLDDIDGKEVEVRGWWEARFEDTPALPDVLALHAKLLQADYPYCYFELAYTRTTMWMVWLCTNARELDANRKVLASGQGSTPEEAAKAALDNYKENNAKI